VIIIAGAICAVPWKIEWIGRKRGERGESRVVFRV
jgi:hypothetical protein